MVHSGRQLQKAAGVHVTASFAWYVSRQPVAGYLTGKSLGLSLAVYPKKAPREPSTSVHSTTR